jgi:hypothetical protein
MGRLFVYSSSYLRRANPLINWLHIYIPFLPHSGLKKKKKRKKWQRKTKQDVLVAHRALESWTRRRGREAEAERKEKGKRKDAGSGFGKSISLSDIFSLSFRVLVF